MPTGFDTALEFLGWAFGGGAILSRILKQKTGQSLGEMVDSWLGQETENLKNTPVKVQLRSPKNVEERAKYVAEMIRKYCEDRRIREIASDILARRCGKGWCIPEKDWVTEVKTVFDALRNGKYAIRYTRDPSKKDLFVSPVRTILQYRIGDCDDLTIALGAVLCHIGYPLKLKVVQTTGYKDFNHIYLLVGIPPMRPQKWLAADLSVNMPLGFQAPPDKIIRKKYIPV